MTRKDSSMSDTPAAYTLMRLLPRVRQVSWRSEDLDGFERAPVYLFKDQGAFDSDDVEPLAIAVSREPLRLPHEATIFEVVDGVSKFSALVVYARQRGDEVDAVIVAQKRDKPTIWTEVQAFARFTADGAADVEPHPRAQSDVFVKTIATIVWRALGILKHAGVSQKRAVPLTRRPRLKRAGVAGWSWHQVDIDPERILRGVAACGGTHASPRWHIRRGHWRTLSNGRRVFVRECEVGDPARGAVWKDYNVKGAAA